MPWGALARSPGMEPCNDHPKVPLSSASHPERSLSVPRGAECGKALTMQVSLSPGLTAHGEGFPSDS